MCQAQRVYPDMVDYDLTSRVFQHPALSTSIKKKREPGTLEVPHPSYPSHCPLNCEMKGDEEDVGKGQGSASHGGSNGHLSSVTCLRKTNPWRLLIVTAASLLESNPVLDTQ